jgi:hypothetical protein
VPAGSRPKTSAAPASRELQKAPKTSSVECWRSSAACTSKAMSRASDLACASSVVPSMRSDSASARRSKAACWPRAGASSCANAAATSTLRSARSRSSAMMLPAPSQIEFSGISR